MKKLISSCVLMLGAAGAMAQSESDGPSFMQLDADGDGRLSQQEAQADARVAEAFRSLDTDSDGYLSIDEFSALRQ